jgi:hypothetical protein
MRTVNILELDDLIDPEDWCRPLQIISMNGGHSDYYSFESCYTGAPENNSKWVKVKFILGKHFHNKPVRDYNKAMGKFGIYYEFVRGDIPQTHKLSLSGYNITDHTKVSYREDEDYDDDIPF